ncbi:unnamed protein product [Haemonchus placei]|uniref:Transposase n=1 Tax=Haemonchus placei TaxID=6290 RepID=A0A0N4WIV0_HAEPC|nr:unnamed protein product [Haemonchus placei]
MYDGFPSDHTPRPAANEKPVYNAFEDDGIPGLLTAMNSSGLRSDRHLLKGQIAGAGRHSDRDDLRTKSARTR